MDEGWVEQAGQKADGERSSETRVELLFQLWPSDALMDQILPPIVRPLSPAALAWNASQLVNPNPLDHAWRQQLQGARPGADKRHYASPWHRPKPRRRDLVGLEFLHHGSTPLSINPELDSPNQHLFLHNQSSNNFVPHLRLLQVTLYRDVLDRHFPGPFGRAVPAAARFVPTPPFVHACRAARERSYLSGLRGVLCITI